MPKLALSTRLFSGALVHFAVESAGVSDEATKPAAENAAWLEIGHVEILKHNPKLHTDEFSKPDAVRGWIDGKDEFVTADIFDLTTKEVSALSHRLSMGTAATPVAGTAQTPFAASDRKVRGWIKIQSRMPTGADRRRIDIFCEIRLKEDPADEKAVQKPVLELWVLHSTLNSFVIPS